MKLIFYFIVLIMLFRCTTEIEELSKLKRPIVVVAVSRVHETDNWNIPQTILRDSNNVYFSSQSKSIALDYKVGDTLK